MVLKTKQDLAELLEIRHDAIDNVRFYLVEARKLTQEIEGVCLEVNKNHMYTGGTIPHCIYCDKEMLVDCD